MQLLVSGDSATCSEAWAGYLTYMAVSLSEKWVWIMELVQYSAVKSRGVNAEDAVRLVPGAQQTFRIYVL